MCLRSVPGRCELEVVDVQKRLREESCRSELWLSPDFTRDFLPSYLLSTVDELEYIQLNVVCANTSRPRNGEEEAETAE